MQATRAIIYTIQGHLEKKNKTKTLKKDMRINVVTY